MFISRIFNLTRIPARSFAKRNLTQAAVATFQKEPEVLIDHRIDEDSMKPKDLDKMMFNLMKFNDCMATNQFKEAHVVLAKHRTQLKKYVPSDHPSLLSVLHNKAMLFKLEGNLLEAKKALKKIVGRYEDLNGFYHPSTLSALTNLGTVYSDLD